MNEEILPSEKDKNTNNKIKNPQKLIYIVVITVLSILCICAVGTSIYLYNDKQKEIENYSEIIKNAQENYSKLKEEYAKENPFLSFNDVKKYFDTKYVGTLDNKLISEALAKAYVEASNDPYAKYFTEEEWEEYNNQMQGSSYGIGVNASLRENGILVVRVFANSPADKAGIKPGDLIVAAGDVEFKNITLQEAVNAIKGEKGHKVLLRIIRNEKAITLECECNDYEIQTVYYETIEKSGNKIAYITITDFYEITYNEFVNAINKTIEDNCVGIIFDLRGNLGGYLSTVCQILDLLLPQGTIVKIETKDEEGCYEISSDENVMIDVPMVVLANGQTASAGELFTSALKDYQKAVVVGEVTYGKGCGQNVFKINNGGYLKMTTFYYNPPLSDNYNGIGIMPNIEVEKSEELKNTPIGVIDKELDNQLQKALEEIIKNIK